MRWTSGNGRRIRGEQSHDSLLTPLDGDHVCSVCEYSGFHPMFFQPLPLNSFSSGKLGSVLGQQRNARKREPTHRLPFCVLGPPLSAIIGFPRTCSMQMQAALLFPSAPPLQKEPVSFLAHADFKVANSRPFAAGGSIIHLIARQGGIISTHQRQDQETS
jgi:hypothetical protein